MENRLKVLYIIAYLLLILLIVCAFLYWSTGVFYPISGAGLPIFIIVIGAIQSIKRKK